MNTKFQQLVKLFQRLPGVGPRQAARFVIALIEQPEESLRELGESINNLKRDVSFCNECFNISDNSHCHICHDMKRDRAKLMIVEKITDLESVEKTGLYKGLYHVLGGAINPLDKINPANLRIKELEKRLGEMAESNDIELIIATNPNTPGETTALYLRELFASASWRKKSVSITRLGRGLSSGSHLEYADEITLKNALEYRK
ncbi:MAG: recombination protein RecR [Candidatus Yanofskybacteria bacterium RIFCSPHIGHO2_01_FULL_43_42]|uniref:Recombination protein RecR n=1 Tax=Candidatus Yanofskybacteria bacterium RIFCSPLOWO2_01_FULL_43_22 TaxID=1802695 RepID=A0A1F8GDA6_9BACT|nr:MAG: recombination protein RecR [Candidatus Yanofskybacteria bacterium RIFCSPHIGHO2_01_FULL_43_42]OGN12648.1 MAG: recombination protein RecR [Candidatus Yanofskybacteria bacterium RIFCSPHIGHO2_02_FULL_43_17]OGN23271.1 MAG: recombination protein RecR [Candidatus Yanofskybacteria bacterium RIFCSPLOWO2_01_FULL_43_22]